MRKIDKIFVHYTDSADVSAATIRAWHLARGYIDIGYHKVIRRDGSLEIGRPEAVIGAHTKGYNTTSLGVVVTGSNREPWYPAASQYTGLATELKDWEARYNIPPANIFFHREKNPTSCPGRLDKSKLFALLGQVPIMVPTPQRTAPRGNQGQRTLPPLIRRGSKGSAVMLLQQRLGIHLVRVIIDGDFGRKTEKGVRKFQAARHILVDGIVGRDTWTLLLQPRGR